MAFPEDLSKISINFDHIKIEEIVSAIKRKKVEWVEGSSSLFAELCTGDFMYKDHVYRITEHYELCTSIHILDDVVLEGGPSKTKKRTKAPKKPTVSIIPDEELLKLVKDGMS